MFWRPKVSFATTRLLRKFISRIWGTPNRSHINCVGWIRHAAANQRLVQEGKMNDVTVYNSETSFWSKLHQVGNKIIGEHGSIMGLKVDSRRVYLGFVQA